MQLTDSIDKEQLREGIPQFRVGDVVKVHFSIVEGSRERIQIFEGLVIDRSHSSIRSSFCVRKISFGIGVERIFPLHSPRIQKIEVMRRGKVRQANLFYIRHRVGKAAKVQEDLSKS